VRGAAARSFAGGLGVARPARTPRGSDGGYTGDGRQWWGRENGPMRRRSKATAELRWPGRMSTSPAAGGGDVEGEAWSKRGGQWGRGGAHRGGGDDGIAAVVRSAGMDMRLRKRGGGDGVLRRALAREDERERIEGRGGDAMGSGGRVTGGATRRREVGAWGQRGGQAAPRGWQRPDHGTHGRCTCERRAIGSETGAGGS
jgi:hypothetical protein